MIEAPTSCAAHIELATLSAWRDRALSAGEYRRLAGHVAACAACQYRLRILDTIGHLLQRRDTDDYQDQIWQRLHAQMHRPAMLRPAIAPRLIAAVSVVLIVALFVLVTYQREDLHQGQPMATATALPSAPTAVPVATPIVLAQAQLHWQPTASRAWQAAGDSDTVWFAPAPSDGIQAYVCTQLPGTSVVQLWKTNNRGVNWLSLGTIPSVANGSCNVTVDQRNPNLVILGITQNARATPIFMKSSISHDGGKTWQNFLQGEYVLDMVFGATTSYAVLSDAASTNTPYLAMSRDGFTTWQKIMPSPARPFAFWVSRSGELLLASDHNKMWLTDDQGQTWRSIAIPDDLGDTQAYQQTGAAAWSICGSVAPTHLSCSQDSGQTWQSYLVPESSVDDTTLLGVAADTTLIVSLLSNPPTAHQDLYRFSPQLGQWQPLGTVPDATAAFVQTTGGTGILWAWYTASPGDDAQQRNFTAVLP